MILKNKERLIIFTMAFLMIFSVGTAIIIKTFDYIQSQTDMESFFLVAIARILTIVGFLFIIIFAFLKGDFRNIEKPKNDILDLHEKIENLEKEEKKIDKS